MSSESLLVWLKAARLRTLPLAISSIAMGGFLATAEKRFNWSVFLLAVITTLLLQILSNLANDYGDSVHGADSPQRIGPQRMVQRGAISRQSMKRAMIVLAIASLISGSLLIAAAFGSLKGAFPLVFFLLGIAAIAAAIKYTAGRNPYGYRGLGDLFVFLFFGIIGVAGSYFLLTGTLHGYILLPAASVGLLTTGVLNVNNMRDMHTDRQCGKITIPVRLGPVYAKYYHLGLIMLAWAASLLFTSLTFRSPVQLLYFVSAPLFGLHLVKVFQIRHAALLDGQLKMLVAATLLYCLTFGAGYVLAA
ncbi:MAG: 1,4-dihydroxy-2-naphthoate octaprenyltransferase [Chitinophagales bacterium]|nr:MAG: 1,4-dihydroxy-2-naphthoate octaprenyltransferase [Chitinophagales bacterium]